MKDPIMRTFIFCIGSTVLFLIVAHFFIGCARATGAVHAESIPSNDGSQCYAIFDSNENPIGGNCK